MKGVHYELDCLVFASGFEVGTSYERRSGYDTIGRDGEKLSEHWTDGMQLVARDARARLPEPVHLGFAQGANLDLERDVATSWTPARPSRRSCAHALEHGCREVEVDRPKPRPRGWS